uniref:Uncharacterized protein n=1 Tax=Helianthus annuus TaxID=4232 RepID=A0A251TZG9_HELAN
MRAEAEKLVQLLVRVRSSLRKIELLLRSRNRPGELTNAKAANVALGKEKAAAEAIL